MAIHKTNVGQPVENWEGIGHLILIDIKFCHQFSRAQCNNAQMSLFIAVQSQCLNIRSLLFTQTTKMDVICSIVHKLFKYENNNEFAYR